MRSRKISREMLKKWISEIRTQSDLYKAECWKYHLSGNVIELSILPAYIKHKESYRCSVIAVGQVLHALSKKIEEEHLNFHIQSFSNLENPEIVATIRTTDEKNEFTGDSKSKGKKESPKQDAIVMLNTLAKRYQLDVHQIENPSKIELKEIPLDNYSTWMVLSSKFNNPFTWLNIGYLKEALRSKFPPDSSNSEHLCIVDLCSVDTEQYSNLKVPENRHIQSLIGIQSANLSGE